MQHTYSSRGGLEHSHPVSGARNTPLPSFLPPSQPLLSNMLRMPSNIIISLVHEIAGTWEVDNTPLAAFTLA
jgi:hypothetical protein